jgi:hypothetical protein
LQTPERRKGREPGETRKKEANVAEIRVERKERRNILPWILGLVLLALVIWGLAEMTHQNDQPADKGAEAVDVTIPEQPPALRQYALVTVDPLAPLERAA